MKTEVLKKYSAEYNQQFDDIKFAYLTGLGASIPKCNRQFSGSCSFNENIVNNPKNADNSNNANAFIYFSNKLSRFKYFVR